MIDLSSRNAKFLNKLRVRFKKQKPLVACFALMLFFAISYANWLHFSQSQIDDLRATNKALTEQNKKIDGELFFEKYRDRTIIGLAEPIAVEGKLITPIMNLYRGYPFYIDLTLKENWIVGDYNFTYLKDSKEYTYFLPIKYKNNEQYQLTFRTWETEFQRCDFSGIEDDNMWTTNFVEVTKILTNIGMLRIGHNTTDDYFVVCQENVAGLEDKTTDWVSVTDIGWILINKPKGYDMNVINEMISMIRSMKVIRVN